MLKIAPDFSIAHFNKGRALQASGRIAEAAVAYRAFLQHAAAGESGFAAEARKLLADIERQQRK